MAMVTDPVCGKRFDHSEATAHTVHEGATFYFCSTACQQAFEADPAQFTTYREDDDSVEAHEGMPDYGTRHRSKK
jgi:YHS domain-containing protein